MCRKNQMRGGCLICLGVGILLGQWVQSVFLCVAGGLLLLCLGCCLLRKR